MIQGRTRRALKIAQKQIGAAEMSRACPEEGPQSVQTPRKGSKRAAQVNQVDSYSSVLSVILPCAGRLSGSSAG
eukprot:5268722-Pyramimonas_sp.AAC.1